MRYGLPTTDPATIYTLKFRDTGGKYVTEASVAQTVDNVQRILYNILKCGDFVVFFVVENLSVFL